MKLCGKLWEVGSVEAFQQVFIDCVECHYRAYADARVLHRELSENDLMFMRDENGVAKGVLNDWDTLSYVEADNETTLWTPMRHAGTIRFMACDLLTDDNPPPHLYRHDLESFFYILIWAALHYKFARRKKLRRIVEVSSWDPPTLWTARCTKVAFIADREARDSVFAHVRLECQTLLPWLRSLGDLFHEGSLSSQQRIKPLDWDNNTQGGHITFEKFMAALG